MPRMDGTSAAGLMRESGISVPIVALTAHALDDERERILRSGYSHFVSKPVDIDKLLALVAELMGGSLEDVAESQTANAVDDGAAVCHSVGDHTESSQEQDDLNFTGDLQDESVDDFEMLELSRTHAPP